ncbi:Murein DD-endopeptidase MepM [Nymphon striatum]|nr:Murein DD-endopeptidase MepM [Nymphon striatum]
MHRGLMLAGFFAVLGNVPVSSHLLESQPNRTQSFEISLKNLQEKSTTQSVNTQNTNTPEITVSNKTETKTLESSNQAKKELVFEAPQIEDSQELELPLRAIETYVGHVADDAYSKWKTYHVKSYDNLTNIFHKINQQALLKPLQENKKISKVLNKLGKGSIARAKSLDGELSELVFTTNNINSFIVTKKDDKFHGEWKKNVFEVRQARASFTINNGLFFDGRKAGITDKVVKQIVKVFDWDIDFSHDVRIGDKVTAVYEEVFHDGDKVDSRHLLAAEFINKGHATSRYSLHIRKWQSRLISHLMGREMKKAFIRTPVAHARVSSHFNPSRYHPKLHKIRAHKGTDFAARTGTAIMATGNGKVKFIGRKGGYGRTVVIQHREGYTTLYAHMSKYQKGLKQGDTVIQGERIGYVGRSGLASGPHLHYEFRHNEKPVNPMTVALPNSMSLSSRELKDFRSNAVNLVLQLNVLHRFVKADIEINSAFGG